MGAEFFPQSYCDAMIVAMRNSILLKEQYHGPGVVLFLGQFRAKIIGFVPFLTHKMLRGKLIFSRERFIA